MLTLSCTVTGRYREGGDGLRYVLDTVSSHSIVPGIANPQGLDHARTHVSIFNRSAAVSRIRLQDLDPDRFASGGIQIVLGAIGWLQFNVFGGDNSDGIFFDLEHSLFFSHLFVWLSVEGAFRFSERVTIEQWLKGERYRQDLSFSTTSLPDVGLVRRS